MARRGQSLIEVLVAIAVGTILILGAARVIAPSAKTSTQVGNIQVETALATQLENNVRVWAAGNWNALLALSTSTTSTYYLITTTSPFVATSGIESITESTSTFTRYFSVSSVYRDTNDNIVSIVLGTIDPSTMLITVGYGGPQGTSSTASFYLTRNIANAYDQSDWSGGPGANTAVTSTGNTFATSTNILYTSTTGSLFIATQFSGASSSATSSISSSSASHWGWSDPLGWIDFYNGNNVGVSSNGLSGYASSSAGPISLDCNTSPIGNICGTSNYQVLNNGAGTLSGWAWNDKYGWISFNCSNNSGCGTSSYAVTIDSNGNFQGFAWNDALGWINFNCDSDLYGTGCTNSYKVATNWAPTVAAATGTLYSTPFDTGDTATGGAQLNSILWQGTQPSGATVEFQVAVSNSSSGPWTFTGPGGSTSTYYVPSLPDTSIPLNFSGSYNNAGRYFRYGLFMLGSNASTSWSPQVNDVIVNWSP